MLRIEKHYFWLIGVLALGIVLFWSGQSWSQPTKLRFSTVPFIGEAPSYVAYHMGFFKDEGLDITLKFNPGGWMSLKELFENRADIATVAELPIVYSAFDKKKYTDFERGEFLIIGDMIYSQSIQQVVVRKDRGINIPADLKGKKIGVMRGTTLDFFMDVFFTDNRIKYSEVEIFDMDVFKMTEAIVRGDLDAIFTWEPHVHIAKKRLGDNAAILDAKMKYTTAWLIIVMKDFAERHPEVLEKFLRAIVKAENFIKKNPKEAIDIHATISKADKSIITHLWNLVDFDLSLSEHLLIIMENEASWLLRKKIYDQKEIPNFKDYIYFKALEKVKPKGIQIVR